jgi:hypothetical protein
MDGFWNHATEIIGEAGKGPLNLIALALLCSMSVAYIFFRSSANWVKLSTYLGLLLFLGVAVIAMAVIFVTSSTIVQQSRQTIQPTPQHTDYTSLQPSLPPIGPVQSTAPGMETLMGNYSGLSTNVSSIGTAYGKMQLPDVCNTGWLGTDSDLGVRRS